MPEQSKTSSEKISKLINNISDDTKIIVKNTDVMNDELSNQALAINTTVEVFKDIIGAVENIIPKIENINDSVGIIDNEKNNISDMVENSSAIAEEVSALSEEISVSSQEMISPINEVATTAEKFRYGISI